MYARVYVCIYVCVYVCMDIVLRFRDMYVYTYVCVYTYVRTCYVRTNPTFPSSRCKCFVFLRPV